MSPILDDYGGDILDLSCETPMSRTHQYRKVMKPLLERKRRARINKCLDDLKELMVTALQAEGESITKLEKADVLEMTVRHLQKLDRQRRLTTTSPTSVDHFRDGFAACVTEVGRFVTSTPDAHFAPHLMAFLGQRLHTVDGTRPITVNVASPSSSSTSSSTSSSKHLPPPTSLSSTDCGYVSDRDSVSPSTSVSPVPAPGRTSNPLLPVASSVWRPF